MSRPVVLHDVLGVDEIAAVLGVSRASVNDSGWRAEKGLDVAGRVIARQFIVTKARFLAWIEGPAAAATAGLDASARRPPASSKAPRIRGRVGRRDLPRPFVIRRRPRGERSTRVEGSGADYVPAARATPGFG